MKAGSLNLPNIYVSLTAMVLNVKDKNSVKDKLPLQENELKKLIMIFLDS